MTAHPRKRFLTVALSLTLVAQAVVAQEKPASQRDQDDVIKINTTLVQLHAVVTDRKGQIVDNLKQEDFEVFENGVPQEIKSFSLEQSLRGQNGSPASPTATGTPVTMTPTGRPPAQTPARVVVLFVDTLHLSIQTLVRTKQQLKEFVDKQLTDDDLVAIVEPSGSLGVLQQFMRDRAGLKYAIDKIAPFQPTSSLFSPYLASLVLSDDGKALAVATQILSTEEGSVGVTDGYIKMRATQILEEERNFRRATLQTLKAVSERLAAMRGQRMIAYVSDGFTLRDRGGGGDMQELHAATGQAVRAGVLIYTFNAKGLSTPVEFQASTQVPKGMDAIDFTDYMNRSEQDQKEVLRIIADETGANVYLNRNDLHNLLNDMFEENRSYYTLAYYPQDDKDKKKFRKIKLQVRNHPEYKVRVQNGYQPTVESIADAAKTPHELLLRAIVAPLPAIAIGVTSSANFLVRADDDAQATLQVHLDAGAFEYAPQGESQSLRCQLAGLMLDRQGKVANSFSEDIKVVLTSAQLAEARRNGFRFDKRLSLRPGLYQIRVGVRDSTSGAIGTVSSWLEVPDLENKKLAMSGIFLGQGQQAEGATKVEKKGVPPKLMTGRMVFKNRDTIFYRFVVYNAAAVDGLLKVEINQGGESIYAGDWQPMQPRIVRNDGKGLEAGGQINATLPPGFYTLTISFKDPQSKKSVQQTVEFEVGL
jgi:VWFA-related protein